MRPSDRMLSERLFKVWEYHVSLGSLLIRSPAVQEYKTNIDLIFTGLIYLSGPTYLGRISFLQTNELDTKHISGLLGENMRESQIWTLDSSSGKLFLVGAYMRVEENTHDPFTAPPNWRDKR